MKRVSNRINAFLGKGTEFEGKLTFDGMVRIDGRFKGEISTEGTLIVGETGVIDAEISATRIIASGEVRGIVVAKERIEVLVPGKVFADLQAPVVTIDAGVVFEGNCQTQNQAKGINDKVASLQKGSDAGNEP